MKQAPMKKFKYFFMNLLPESIQGKIIRNGFNLNYRSKKFDKISFELATSKSDIEQSFRLVKKEYNRVSISTNREELFHITKYHCLPTTKIFVAKYKGKVIATVTVILDSEFKLPIETFTDISKYRDTGKKIAEISSLAISSKWRRHNSFIFMKLCIFLFRYSKEIISVDYLVMATKSHVKKFYKHAFFFEPIDNVERIAEHANKSLAFAQVMKTKDILPKVKENYSYEQYRNISNIIKSFDLYFERFDNEKVISQYLFTQEVFLDFFRDKNNILGKLSENEKLALKNFYDHTHKVYESIEELNGAHSKEDRRFPRYHANYKVLALCNKRMVEGKTLEVSRGGLSIISDRYHQIGDRLTILLETFDGEVEEFHAHVRWAKGSRYGLKLIFKENRKIQNTKIKWNQFMNKIETAARTIPLAA